MIKDIGKALAAWREKPSDMVRELFKVEPDDFQAEALDSYPHTPRIAMKAAKGPGKLQPKSMVLDTPAGLRRWGDLRPGDEVFAEDGSPTRILKTFENGVVPQYRVTFDDGSSTLCGADHLWKVRGANERRRQSAWAVLTTQAIMNRGVRNKNGRWAGRQFEIPNHGAVQYPAAYQALDAYVLGVWLGDGDKNSARYTGIDKDVEAEITLRGYRTGGESRNGQTRTIYGLAAQLRPLGLMGTGSYERFVPPSYRQASIQQRQDILSGLMDTDGCIGDDSHMEFDSTSRQLADDVVWLVRSLGGVAFLKGTIKKPWYYGKDRKRITGRDCYRVTVRTPFNPFKIARKAERWKPADNKSKLRYLTRYIDRIDPAPAEDSMCIEVAHPSRCYLANDFIVTHNTACMAWIAWNFLLTRDVPVNCAATSISGDNLRDGLQKEMAYWRNRTDLLMAWFEQTSEKVFAKDAPDSKFLSFRTWSKSSNKEQIGATLAGLHARHMLFLIDETGAMPQEIVAAAEGGFSSAEECHIIQAGNTNTLEGALYAACVKLRHLWKVIQITGDPDDPKRSKRMNLEWCKEMIATYGRDDPFVKVMVLGEWPKQSMNALLGPDDVEAAFNRRYQQWDIETAARVLGVDVALEGDDKSVIFPRQGLVGFKPWQMRNVRSDAGAGQVARVWQDWDVNACFVDNTGGFGAGWVDQLRLLNRQAIPVGFAEKAEDKRYYNRRAEMYFRMAQWVKNGGALPREPELVAELTETTYTFKGDRLIMEPKAVVKAKISRSPDLADALALTFAAPVAPRVVAPTIARKQDEDFYDPFDSFVRRRA